MASINGISVKNLKKFRGHEGEPLFQGSLYLGGKKIGSWSQDYHNGPDDIDLEGNLSETLLNKAVAARNPDKAIHSTRPDGSAFTVEYDLSLLLDDFISLLDDEKEFKKAVKQGYSGILIATDSYHTTTWHLPKRYTDMTDDTLLSEMQESIEEAKAGFFEENERTKHITKIYRSPNDFDIGEPIPLAEITTA